MEELPLGWREGRIITWRFQGEQRWKSSIQERGEASNHNNWTPVIYKHRRQQSKGNRLANSVTLFVDNKHDEVDMEWLKKTFTQFGIVNDFYPLQKK